MLRLPDSHEGNHHNIPMKGGQALRREPYSRTLDERFIRILKIFKWGPDAEKAARFLR